MTFVGMHSYRIGKSVPQYDLTDGWYCSHWGLTDLYPECESALRDLLKSGRDFITEWCGSKKEIVSARYSRIEGKVIVEVAEDVDDLWGSCDLIYDVMYDLGKGDVEIPEDAEENFREYIYQLAVESGVDDHAYAKIELPCDASYEDCMAAADKAWYMTETELDDQYKRLKGIVADALSFPWDSYRNEVEA